MCEEFSLSVPNSGRRQAGRHHPYHRRGQWWRKAAAHALCARGRNREV